MKQPFEVLLPLIIVPLLLSFPVVHAAVGDPPIVVEPIINIDLQGVIDAINTLNGDVGSDVNAVPTGVFSIFTGWIDSSLLSFNNLVLDFSEFLITTNPDVEGMQSWHSSIVLIISSLYLLVFLVIGFMFLFYSINTEKRAKAKEWLTNAFIMIIGVNVSFYLYRLILELATAIAQFMWVTGFENFFDASSSGLNTVFLVFNLGAVALAAITLFARYLFLLGGVLLFPIGIFLYFIPPLQNWGKMIFNLIGVFLFMQFVDVLVFIAAEQIAVQLAGEGIAPLVIPFAFLMIAVINILMIVYAVLKSAFSASDNAPVLAFMLGAMTGQIGALVNAIPKPSPQTKITNYTRE
jgi:hypothetical protein